MVRREVYSRMGGAVNLKIHALNKRVMRAGGRKKMKEKSEKTNLFGFCSSVLCFLSH